MTVAHWKHLRERGRRIAGWDGFWWIIGMVGVLIISGGLSWRYWGDLHGAQDSLSTTIRNLGLVVGGIEAILLAAWRSIVAQRQTAAAQRQAATSQQGLLNERYQRGAEMLGSEILSVRLGGIYALDRLAAAHPEQYHVQVMELFCAFARNPAGRGEERTTAEAYAEYEQRPSEPIVREDVQAVLNAISYRSRVRSQCEVETDNFRLDLRGAYLREAQLHGANLSGAILSRADLTLAEISGAVLDSSDLRRANLDSANLSQANLLGANMANSNLTGADLTRANLTKADLYRANVIEADLSGATLHRANLNLATLTTVDFSRANLTEATFWLANLRYADFSGADLSRSSLQEADLSGASIERAVNTGRTLARTQQDGFVRLTQAQLDEAAADLGEPPSIARGNVDIETGELLVWHGQQRTGRC